MLEQINIVGKKVNVFPIEYSLLTFRSDFSQLEWICKKEKTQAGFGQNLLELNFCHFTIKRNKKNYSITRSNFYLCNKKQGKRALLLKDIGAL